MAQPSQTRDPGNIESLKQQNVPPSPPPQNCGPRRSSRISKIVSHFYLH